jgi:hypothetical protein
MLLHCGVVQISGDMASATVNSGSLADLPNLANASLYGFEDYHGVDIGVVKAVRIWFTAAAGEMPVEITLEEGDTKLGFAISRTEEVRTYPWRRRSAREVPACWHTSEL